jgi:predicted RNA binding protein YcfA (HicA-like mRNA interferase family)
MSRWPAAKAQRVLAALLRIGWTIKRQSGSHRTLQRPGGRISCSRSMIAMRSARECSRALPDIPA